MDILLRSVNSLAPKVLVHLMPANTLIVHTEVLAGVISMCVTSEDFEECSATGAGRSQDNEQFPRLDKAIMAL
jgi:hypothetical protein